MNCTLKMNAFYIISVILLKSDFKELTFASQWFFRKAILEPINEVSDTKTSENILTFSFNGTCNK